MPWGHEVLAGFYHGFQLNQEPFLNFQSLNLSPTSKKILKGNHDHFFRCEERTRCCRLEKKLINVSGGDINL